MNIHKHDQKARQKGGQSTNLVPCGESPQLIHSNINTSSNLSKPNTVSIIFSRYIFL